MADNWKILSKILKLSVMWRMDLVGSRLDARKQVRGFLK